VGKGIQRARCPRGPEELQVVETMEDSVGDDSAGAGRLRKSQCNVPLHLQQHGGECWHEIWPGGFGGVRGLTAPIRLRLRASGRWLAAPMDLACPHAEEEA